MILHDYYKSIKYPVDKKILYENLEKLAKILDVDK
jgi:hypothetical protein